MRKFLNKVGKNGYGLFPHGMEVELKETKESGQISTHKEFLNKAHEEYQIHILGQAGTTGENAEGYASTSVLNGIRMDIIENVGQLSGKGYEKLVGKGLNVNYGDEYEPHLAPTIKPIYLNSADAKKMAQAAEILNNKMGLSIPERHLYEQVLGIEKPEDGTMVLMNGEIVEKSEAEEMTPSSQQQKEQVAQSTREADETGDTSVANDGRN
jgi:phage gp29-like protein